MARIRQVTIAMALLAGLVLAAANWRAGAVYLLGLAVAYLALRRVAVAGVPEELLAVFCVALFVRIAWVAVIHWVLPELALGQRLMAADPELAERAGHLGIALFWDEWKYEDVAWGIAQWWAEAMRGGASANLLYLVPDVYLQAQGAAFGMSANEAGMYLQPHVYLNAALYSALGREPLAARTVHAIYGAAVPCLIFLLALDWFGFRPARLAGWAAALEPALIFWSAWMLKEMLVLGLIAALLLVAGRVAGRPRPGWVLAMVAGLLVLLRLRPPLGVYLGLLLLLAVVGVEGSKTRRVGLAALMLLLSSTTLWLGGEGFMGTNRLNPGLPSELAGTRADAGSQSARTFIGESPSAPPQAAGDSRSAPPPAHGDRQGASAPVAAARPSAPSPSVTPATILQFRIAGLLSLESLGITLVHVLGAPFPWAAETTKDWLALLLMPSWYAALVLAVPGLISGWRRQWRALALPVAFLAATLLYLSVTETVVGNMVRHRTMLLPVLLPSAAYGLLVLNDARVRLTGRLRPRLSQPLSLGR